jgi:tRNA modification GTPase
VLHVIDATDPKPADVPRDRSIIVWNKIDLLGSAGVPPAIELASTIDVLDPAARAPLPRSGRGLGEGGRSGTAIDVLDPATLTQPSPAARERGTRVSAKTGFGLDSLRQAIADALGSETAGAEALVTSQRHASALADALGFLDKAGEHLAAGSSELAGVEADQAVRSLGTITGEDATADLIDAIFARFCIGK